MKVTDYFKLSKSIYKNNKFRTFISIAIVAVLSFVYMFILFVGFSYYNNSKKIEEDFLRENPISLSLIMEKSINFDSLIDDARKTKPSIILFEASYITLVDFKTLNYDDLDLKNGLMPQSGNYEIIVNENSNIAINDIVIVNEKECLVVGIYESKYFEGPIGDIVSFSNIIDISSISFIYQYDIVKNNLTRILDFSIKMQDIGHEEFTSKVLEQVKQYRSYSNLILIVCILVVVLIFACTIGFYLNSIAMCYDQGKRIFTLLNIVGGSNKDSIFIMFVYTLIISVVGISISAIPMVFFVKIINIKELFVSVIPSLMMSAISIDFKYDNSFPWIIPIIVSLLFIFTVYIYCHKLIKKEYKEQSDILTIKNL